MIDYDYDGNIRWKQTYKYDDEGNQVEFISYYSDGSINSKYTFEYQYDKTSNYTKKVRLKDGVAISVLEREFEYYD